MYKIESKIRYNIELKSDTEAIVIKAFKDNGLIGDGVTKLDDARYNSMYKNNMRFIDRCISRGSFIITNIPEIKKEEKKAEVKAEVKEEKKEEAKVEVKATKKAVKSELEEILKAQEASKIIASSDDIPKTDMSEAEKAIGVNKRG